MTRSFSLDGRDYEIDLCDKHSQKFDEVLSKFAEKARKVTGRAGQAQAADHCAPSAQCRHPHLGEAERHGGQRSGPDSGQRDREVRRESLTRADGRIRAAAADSRAAAPVSGLRRPEPWRGELCARRGPSAGWSGTSSPLGARSLVPPRRRRAGGWIPRAGSSGDPHAGVGRAGHQSGRGAPVAGRSGRQSRTVGTVVISRRRAGGGRLDTQVGLLRQTRTPASGGPGISPAARSAADVISRRRAGGEAAEYPARAATAAAGGQYGVGRLWVKRRPGTPATGPAGQRPLTGQGGFLRPT